MRRFHFFALPVFAALSVASLPLETSEAVCPRCEEIREYNAVHHRNYEYYEDYLKAQQEKSFSASPT